MLSSLLLVLGGTFAYCIYLILFAAWSFWRNIQETRKTGLPYILARLLPRLEHDP